MRYYQWEIDCAMASRNGMKNHEQSNGVRIRSSFSGRNETQKKCVGDISKLFTRFYGIHSQIIEHGFGI